MQTVIECGALRGVPIVFPVVHQYSERSAWRIAVKGSDAILFDLLRVLGGRPSIRYYYDVTEYGTEVDYAIERGRITVTEGNENVDTSIIAEVLRALNYQYTEPPNKRARTDEHSEGKHWHSEAMDMREIVLLSDKADEILNDNIIEESHNHISNMNCAGKFHKAIFANSDAGVKPKVISAAGHYGNEASVVSYKGNVCIVAKW